MTIGFEVLKDAVEFVVLAPMGGAEGYVNRETGETYLYAEETDLDELPEDIEDDKYVRLPGKNDLDLGKSLVIDFAYAHLPDDVGRVHEIFRKRGAYSRFKSLLDDRGLLQTWYAFESEAQDAALREWCKRNNLDI